MSITEYLLTCLAEECMEVGQRAHKAQRFGLTEVQEGQDQNNAERIEMELDDLHAVVEMLEVHGLIAEGRDRSRIEAKQEKLAKYIAYSRKVGTLT